MEKKRFIQHVEKFLYSGGEELSDELLSAFREVLNITAVKSNAELKEVLQNEIKKIKEG